MGTQECAEELVWSASWHSSPDSTETEIKLDIAELLAAALFCWSSPAAEPAKMPHYDASDTGLAASSVLSWSDGTCACILQRALRNCSKLGVWDRRFESSLRRADPSSEAL